MILDWQKIDSMPPEEIENIRIECIKELQTMEATHQIIKDDYLHTAREIQLLEIKKSDSRIALGKSSCNIKQKKSDIELLVAKFWQNKR